MQTPPAMQRPPSPRSCSPIRDHRSGSTALPLTRCTVYYSRVRRFRHSTIVIPLVAITLLLALPLLLGGRGGAGAQEATLDFAPYLRRSDGRPADPVNVIFIGEKDVAAV